MAVDIARTVLGRAEVKDRGVLMEYMKNGGVNLDPATTAWCAAFVNATLAQAGIEGTGSNLARSFLDWGEAVDQPKPGDLAVFSRGDPNGWKGHVGFFEGLNPDGSVRVLGGNQGDAVSIANYPADRLLGYRRAPQGIASQQPAAPQAAGTPAPALGPGRNVGAPSSPTAPAGAPPMAFGDLIAPRPAPNFASAIQRFSERRKEQEAEEQQRRALLLGGLGDLYG